MTTDEISDVLATALWSDDPSRIDLLAFSAIADTVTDALLQPGLSPWAVCLSGTWGSGKTTVLELLEGRFYDDDLKSKSIVIRTDPWRYDPTLGARESLMAEVLAAIKDRLVGEEPTKQAALAAVKDLARRVNWAQAFRVAAKTAITLQLPNPDAIDSLIRDTPDEEETKGVAEFHKAFAQLMNLDALKEIEYVVVLVDDLDRCLPETVVDTLEAIRLFLAVPKMSFVLAADEARVAESIRIRLGIPKSPATVESIEKLYLHKIVQTTISMPALSSFDTAAYLFLLLAGQSSTGRDHVSDLIAKCDELRESGGQLAELELPVDAGLSNEFETALLLTPILYHRLSGNPRYIKRFMNDLWVRQSIAQRRGIKLPTRALAKLMVLEKLYAEDFGTVLDWLATNRLEEKFTLLESAAGSDVEDQQAGISANIRRWNSLPPGLSADQIAGYLTLAAAFLGKPLVDPELPPLLQRIASALLSTSDIEQQGVKDEELVGLPVGDAVQLVQHIGQQVRVDDAKQFHGVTGLVRLTKAVPDVLPETLLALDGIPDGRLQVPTVLLLKTPEYRDYLSGRRVGDEGELDRAIDLTLTSGS